MKKVLLLVVLLMASLAAAQTAPTNANTALTGSQCTVQVIAASKIGALVTVGATSWTGTLQVYGVDAQGVLYPVGVTNAQTNAFAQTVTANGAYTASIRGFNYVEVCGNTIATGTVTVTVAVAN